MYAGGGFAFDRDTYQMMKLGRLVLIARVGMFWVSAAAAEASQSFLGRKDVAVEAAVRVLVVRIYASGDRELGQCVHDLYFGSPLRQRRFVSESWGKAHANGYEGLRAELIGHCAEGEIEPRVGVDPELWQRVTHPAVLLDLVSVLDTALAAASEMLEADARRSNDLALAQCAGEKRKTGALNTAVQGIQKQSEKALPATVAVHDALRDLCGLNRDRPPAAELSLPAMPDVVTAARERLLIVQDLTACEDPDKHRFIRCAYAAYEARSKALYAQLLSGR